MRYKSKYYVSKCPVRHYGIHEKYIVSDAIVFKFLNEDIVINSIKSLFQVNKNTTAKFLLFNSFINGFSNRNQSLSSRAACSKAKLVRKNDGMQIQKVI